MLLDAIYKLRPFDLASFLRDKAKIDADVKEYLPLLRKNKVNEAVLRALATESKEAIKLTSAAAHELEPELHHSTPSRQGRHGHRRRRAGGVRAAALLARRDAHRLPQRQVWLAPLVCV